MNALWTFQPITMLPNRFDPLAAAYEDHAVVETEAGRRLLERLDGLRFSPARVLDIGCATGQTCQALHDRFGQAQIIGLDHSAAMLRQARRKRGFWRPRFELLQADLEALPLADASVDMVYANLSLGWSGDPQRALTGLRRVLRPGGLILLSLLGPDTLRQTGLEPELTLRLLPDVQQLAAMLIGAGFSEPVLDTDWLTATYSSRTSLVNELRGNGLLDPNGDDPDLLSATQDSSPRPGALSVELEIVSASAWAPDPGQPIRGAFGDEVSIPASRIGIRRRS
jgi:malonyl-CoA O-methyltransferase